MDARVASSAGYFPNERADSELEVLEHGQSRGGSVSVGSVGSRASGPALPDCGSEAVAGGCRCLLTSSRADGPQYSSRCLVGRSS